MPIDVSTLRKKLSRACDDGARAVLGSLLQYVAEGGHGPPSPETTGLGAGRAHPSQETGRRPTRFQLLQAKFMGTGREPHLKRTREVGRLISKDKPGPGRSLVSATINKLLEKTKEGASNLGLRAGLREKPQRGSRGGRSTVKGIVKKLLAAEDGEKDTGDKPPVQRPPAAGRPPPSLVGRSSILSKLKEKFEQSSCFHTEPSVLPLRRDGRKSRSRQRRKVHRPQVRELHMASLAPSVTRMPPLRLLACTAEPLPALNIATVVCGPRSWQSHCTRISHLDSRRRRPQRETSMSSRSADGTGPPDGEPRGQLEPAAVSTPGADVASCTAPQHGPVPTLSPPGPDSCGDETGPAGGDTTQGAAGPSRGSGETPETATTACSAAGEAGGELLFALQWHCAGQEAAARIPPLGSGAAQAVQQVQPAVESAHVVMQLPTVHETPAPLVPQQRAWSREHKRSYVCGGENVLERTSVALPLRTADGKGHPATGIPAPETLHTAEEPGPRVAARADLVVLQAGPAPAPSESLCGRGIPSALRECKGTSGQSAEVSREKHPSTETNETPAPGGDASPGPHTPQRSHLRWGARQPGQPGLSSWMPVPAQDCMRPEDSTRTTTNKSILCGQEEEKRAMAESILPPRTDQKTISHDLDKDRQSSDETCSMGPGVSGKAVATGNVIRPTVPQLGGAQGPGHKERPQLGAQGPEDKMTGELAALDEQGRGAEGICLVGGAFPRNLCTSACLSPRGSGMHQRASAEGRVSGGTGRYQPPAALTAQPGATARACPVPADAQPCALVESTASTHRAGSDSRNSTAEADNLVSQSPQKSSEGSLGSGLGQPPCVGTRAQSRGGPEPERHPGLGAQSPTAPVPRPVLVEGSLAPGQQALPRAAPQAKSLGGGARETIQAQVDLEGPDSSQLRLEEAGVGHVWSHQARQAGSEEKETASPEQTAQGLAGTEKTPAVGSPCSQRAEDQERPLGPHGEQVSSPAAGDSPQAGAYPATARKLESPGSLAEQGQTPGQPPASRTVRPQTQPRLTVEGAPTAGAPVGPPRPAPRVRDQDSPGTQWSLRGQLWGHNEASACPLEPGHGSARPTSDAKGQPSQASAAKGRPGAPGAERDTPEGECHRRSLHCAKYRAQSFCDQRAFDLSFRPTTLRATDTFEPPK